MALSPSVDFDETSLTAAEFDAQKKVLPNSTVESNDANAIVLRALRRASYLRKSLLVEKREIFSFYEEGLPPTYVIGPPNLFNSSTFVNSKAVLDIAGCVVGDDLEIEAWGDWQLNTASSATVVGRAQIEIIEDVDGTPSIVPNVIGKASIATPGGGTLPHTSNYCLVIKHRTVTAGKTRVALQIASEDLSGGAGTATIILQLSARLDVTRIRRS